MEVIPDANEQPGPVAAVEVTIPQVKRNSKSLIGPKASKRASRSSHSEDKKTRGKRIRAVKNPKNAGEEEKKLKIFSDPMGVENIPKVSNGIVDSVIYGTSFLQPSSNSNFSIDLIANELLSSISNPSLFVASDSDHVPLQSVSSTYSVPSFSIPQPHVNFQTRQSNTESFSCSDKVTTAPGPAAPLSSENTQRFDLEFSHYLMLFSTIFDVCIAPQILLTDIRSCSHTRLFMYKQLLLNDILDTLQKLLLLFNTSSSSIQFSEGSAANTGPIWDSPEQLFNIFSNSTQKLLGVNVI